MCNLKKKKEPHCSVNAVMSDTREMVEGSQQPERSRTVDQYATATKTTASSRTILLACRSRQSDSPTG